jgi:hypothetical protein
MKTLIITISIFTVLLILVKLIFFSEPKEVIADEDTHNEFGL